MKATALALALTLGIGAIGATAQPVAANAGERMMHEGPHMMMRDHPHFRFFFGPRIFLGPPVFEREHFVGPCHWLKVRAEVTGKRYWWVRWRQCLANHDIY